MHESVRLTVQDRGTQDKAELNGFSGGYARPLRMSKSDSIPIGHRVHPVTRQCNLTPLSRYVFGGAK